MLLSALVLLATLEGSAAQPKSRQPRATSTRSRGSGAKDLQRFTRLIKLLHTRRDLRDLFAERLAPLQDGGLMTVIGEQGLLAAVDQRLDEASRALHDIDGDATSIHSRMDDLESVVDGYEWGVLESTLPVLETKRGKQDEVIRQFEETLDGWRKQLDPLQAELAKAVGVKAPVPREQKAHRDLAGLLATAERALADHRYTDVAEPINRLTAAEATPTDLVKRVRAKTDAAQRFSRQADVLLLEAPAESTHSYTVLLRTPSERGSHGINIQDSSCLVKQDRAYIRAVIDRVTRAVEAGIARRHGRESPPRAVTDDRPTVESTATPNPETDVVREWNPTDATMPTGSDVARLDDLSSLIGEVGTVMFRLFMPDRMRQYLATTPCALTITTNDLELPWELMYDSSYDAEPGEEGLGFLCLQRPIARMPMGRAFPRLQRPAPKKTTLKFLLVYADPAGNLPDARREVERIKTALEEQWGASNEDIEIKELMAEQATGEQMNRALLSGEYDVIHFAGHARFDADDPDMSGLLLHDHEVFLAEKIQRFVEGQPLVFLNACETGVTANESAGPQSVGEYFWKPAEGLASAFLYGGALGCVGSLWPVYDQPAAEFAIEFYNEVLEGQMVGEAMRRARRSIKQKHPDSITWASFVLYGDPTFQLVA